jgi:hypothetical protein
MTKSKLWAAEALEDFPEELREKAVAYLLDQGEKFRVLKKLVEEGLADVEAGRVSDWNPDEIWAMAEELAEKERAHDLSQAAGE